MNTQLHDVENQARSAPRTAQHDEHGSGLPAVCKASVGAVRHAGRVRDFDTLYTVTGMARVEQRDLIPARRPPFARRRAHRPLNAMT
jgi:hypothetical protein